jgi:hypothetical protein
LNTARGQRRRHVVIVVVVAEDAVHAVGRRERCEAFCRPLDVLPVAPGDIVAAEHDEVWSFVHQPRHRLRHVLVRNPEAAMDVGEEADSEAVEGRRKTGHGHVRSRDQELVTLVQVAVRAEPGHGARRGCCECLEDSAPADRHRLI